MPRLTIGVLHPGEMGAEIAAALVAGGHDVIWASEGRSAATRARAESAGLRDVGTLPAVVSEAAVIFSICPPHAAVDVARLVAGFPGLYLDANAIAPSTAAEVAEAIESGGGHYVDGGIVGSPLRLHHITLYLSGAAAAGLATDLEGSNFHTRVVSERPGDASALKLAFAAWTKGTSALVLAIRSLARSADVEEALLEAWTESLPELIGRSRQAASVATTKGWRWAGEMEEIAKTFEEVGLPGGFHLAAAEIFRRAPRDEHAVADDETLAKVLAALA
jgi:3-hydroxyisobutyrate dehydrogenase-like beta-hydroxyacid dehydrogenase